MTRLGRPAGRRDLVHEVGDQLGNVLAPLGEARHPDRHDAQPVKQVLAEAAGRDLAREIARRRGYHPHVDMNAHGAADALEVLVDQDAQDLALRLPRHVRDLVEVERAAMRFLERADLPALSVAALDAEELALHVLGRDRGRVDGDEGARRARLTGCGSCGPPVPCPSPARPEIMTRALVAATRSRVWRSWLAACDWPTIRLACCDFVRSSFTSRFRRDASSARSATRTSRSALNGFSMKS